MTRFSTPIYCDCSVNVHYNFGLTHPLAPGPCPLGGMLLEQMPTSVLADCQSTAHKTDSFHRPISHSFSQLASTVVHISVLWPSLWFPGIVLGVGTDPSLADQLSPSQDCTHLN